MWDADKIFKNITWSKPCQILYRSVFVLVLLYKLSNSIFTSVRVRCIQSINTTIHVLSLYVHPPPLQVDKVVLKILSRFNQQIHGQSVLSAYLQVKHLLKTSIFKKARCSETYLIISFKGRVLNKNKWKYQYFKVKIFF